MKKPWGLVDHPWLHPAVGMDLRVTLPKIKIKEVKTKDSCHDFSSTPTIETYPVRFVKRILGFAHPPVFPLARNRVDPFRGFMRPALRANRVETR